jgi:hypothetical protein
MDTLCIEAKKIGIKELIVGPKDWPILKNMD